MKKKNDKYSDPYKLSPIPPHLTPEEREEWIRELEQEEEEVERRKKQGLYKQRPKKKSAGWSACQAWEIERWL